jgi:hypothetical protein
VHELEIGSCPNIRMLGRHGNALFVLENTANIRCVLVFGEALRGRFDLKRETAGRASRTSHCGHLERRGYARDT